MGFTGVADHIDRDFVVNRAISRPEFHGSSEFAVHIGSEIPVGQEHDFPVGGNCADDRFRVSGGTADIDFRFDVRGAVDISDEQCAGIVFLIFADLFRCCHICHGTACIGIGKQDNGVR